MGWLWTLALNGMPALGAYWAARHGFRQPRGLPRVLAAATLAWAWIIAGMEVLGFAGFLDRPHLLAWSAAGLAIGAALKGLDRAPEDGAPAGGGPWEWSATLALGLVLGAATILGARSLMGPVKVVSDGPIYHLYFAARWWRAGRIVLVPTPFGEAAAPYFPAVGDLGFAWLMVGWGGDRLAKVGQAPFYLLAGLAAVAIARRLGAGISAAVVAAAWFLASTPLIAFAFEPNVDMIFVAGYLVAASFFLRYALRDGGAGTLALGALAAGGAWGSKPTASAFVPPLLALAGLAVLGRKDLPAGRRFAHFGLLLALPMVPAGAWFARDAWLTGNPLYPLHVEAFGRTWLPGWYGRGAMRRSVYYIDPGRWRALADTILGVVDPRLAPAWAAALAGAWAIRRRPDPAGRWAWGCAGLAMLNVGLYWGLIPYRNQQRFMLHAVGLAAVPLAMTLDRARWLRGLGAVLLAVHLLTPQAWPLARPWPDLSPAIPSDFPPPIEPLNRLAQVRGSADPAVLAWSLGPVLILIAALVAARLIGQVGARPTLGRRLRAAGASAALAVVAVATARPPTSGPTLEFYPPFDYFPAWNVLDRRCGPAGARVAYAGTNIPYYLLGIGLRNEVRYVNVDDHRGWRLHDYHRAARAGGRPTWPDPRPGWDRLRPDPAAWLANLRAERIDYLFVARADPREGPHNVADRQGFPIERRWADAAFGLLYADPVVRIYELRRNPEPPATEPAPARH